MGHSSSRSRWAWCRRCSSTSSSNLARAHLLQVHAGHLELPVAALPNIHHVHGLLVADQSAANVPVSGRGAR
jgi:hypothetical protein